MSKILESYMIILKNIQDLLNKRIKDLALRDKNNRKKDFIFKIFKEKKAKNNLIKSKNDKSINESLTANPDLMYVNIFKF